MKYIVFAQTAEKVIERILSCVKDGVGGSNKEIKTWQVKKTASNEEVIVHTTDQWEDKGCIELIPSEDNKEIEVRFFYWSTYKEANRSGDESKYLLGRFTELLLVHFWGLFDRISIK